MASFESKTSNELFSTGLSLFNEQQFFDCHEVLEALWNRESEPERQFTQGLIQIAVGIYHLLRENRVGAQKLLPRGLKRIAAFQPTHRAVDVAKLCTDVESLLRDIELGEKPTAEISVPKISFN